MASTHSAYIREGIIYFNNGTLWGVYPSPFVSVAMGFVHEIGLREDGTIRFDGEGTGYINPDMDSVLAVAAGSRHSLILLEGQVFECGKYESGEYWVKEYGDFTAVDGGYKFSMALRANGSILVWGDDVPTEPIPSPNYGFIAIAAGKHHCVALRNDGTIEVWGDGETNPEPELENVIGIAAGYGYSVAITEVVSSIEEEDGSAGVVFGVTSPFGSMAYNSAPQGSYVTVYDMAGRKVGETQNNVWDSGSAPAGVYVFVLGDGISSAMAVKL